MEGTCRSYDEAILQRVQAEFLEMPGLRLTCAQAQRLCGLDGDTCVAVLNMLVDLKFLVRDSTGRYRSVLEQTV